MELQRSKNGKVRPASPESSLCAHATTTTHNRDCSSKQGVKIVQVLPAEPCCPEDASKPGAMSEMSVNSPIENVADISTAASLSLKDQLLQHKYRTLNRVYWVQLMFITSSMAAVETTNKVVLAACTFSFVAGITLDLEARGSETGMALFGFSCLVFLATTAYFTWQVEDMERIAAKYRAADEGLRLEELGRQEQAASSSETATGIELSREEFAVPPLGPVAMSVGNILQVVRNSSSLVQNAPEASSLLWLMTTAKRLSNPFEVQVLCVLHEVLLEDGTSDFPAPVSNLKSYDRAYEKALLDYGKDYRLLKDMLRGSIICKNMKQLRKVWQQLQRLQVEGVLRVLQIKNRFRGKPFPTGHVLSFLSSFLPVFLSSFLPSFPFFLCCTPSFFLPSLISLFPPFFLPSFLSSGTVISIAMSNSKGSFARSSCTARPTMF
jgi:hypothetical protein